MHFLAFSNFCTVSSMVLLLSLVSFESCLWQTRGLNFLSSPKRQDACLYLSVYRGFGNPGDHMAPPWSERRSVYFCSFTSHAGVDAL